MSPERRVDVLLVGGGVASLRCARALRRNGFDGSILLVGDEATAPYNRPPLSKELLRADLPDELVSAEPARWYERHAVELLLEATVVGVDPDDGRATLDDGSTISFDRCLLAPGAEPRTLSVPGGETALLLRTLADSRRLRAAATAAGPDAPVVIVGGGFIGLEVGSALAAMGLRPTIVEMSAPWAGTLGSELEGWARQRLADARVELRVGAAVTRLEPGAAWIGEERLPAALTVAGIGVRPRDELGAGAGLEVNDGIVVDAGHRASRPGIWAAGDVARVEGRRVEHWHAAREHGERAARSMLGLEVPAARAGWVFSEVGGTSIDIFGLPETWEEERWSADRGALAYLRADRLVGLAVIGGAIPAEEARAAVERGAHASTLAMLAPW